MLAGTDYLLAFFISNGVRSTLLVLFLAAITGAVHLDGLADTADALSAGRDRIRALAILRDSRIGAFGAVAGYEVDALFVAERLIVELDSWDYHFDREAFERDRDRDADTLAADHETVRITWTRIEQQTAREAARLHQILELRRRRLAA